VGEGQSAKRSRVLGYALAVVFAAVGLGFLVAPGGVIDFFNTLSRPLGMEASPVSGRSFYLVLTAAYMSVVTLLAWKMGRQPENRAYSVLLAQAKLASSLISFGFFAFHGPFLIYLVNGLVDGAIGAVVYQIAGRKRVESGSG
jgi:hypothetical protein